jgi:RNA polymerase sigma-70 factor (ECF subfamily)
MQMRSFDSDSPSSIAFALGAALAAPEPGGPAPRGGAELTRSASIDVAHEDDGPEACGQLPREWFREHFDRLWHMAARLGVPGDSVDDVVQEAFITASRRRADIAPGQERRFLIGTVIKISSNYRHRACVLREVHQTETLDQSPSPLPNAETILIEKRARRELDAALASLSEAHRNVFVLFELEEFSLAEIAELLAIPLGTVASRLGRARAHFAQSAARFAARARTREGL